MRTDHVLRLNAESTAYADLLRETIDVREAELHGLKRLYLAVVATAEHDGPGLVRTVADNAEAVVSRQREAA
ncbi:hypothetical protein OIU35_31750 [Boseaceae bacterium BT-24-1]|nr:hypothetical protein [Boseaceae bacterium BT-24-1]